MSTISIIGHAVNAGHAVVKAFDTQFSHVLAAGPVESLRLTGPLPMARMLKHVCLLSLGLMTHSVKHTNFSIGVIHVAHRQDLSDAKIRFNNK